MNDESWDRRKEDRHLNALERRIIEVENILRFDVVKRSGTWWKKLDQRLEILETNVRMMNQQAATKAEIDRALRQQTKELKREKASRFTRREKLVGLAISAALVTINILEIVLR
jgi:hypothetical protein